MVLTFIDGEGKSGASYASLYAEENGIAADCVIGPSDFRGRFSRHIDKHGKVAALVVMDDIAATGASLCENIAQFLAEFGSLLQGVKVRMVTLVATAVAQEAIAKRLRSFSNVDLDFRSCEILPADAYAFPEGAMVWPSDEQEARARALCEDLGSRIYKQNPLGFGGLGLLIVFPTTVPNNTVPIIHSFARPGSGLSWKPLFPRVVN